MINVITVTTFFKKMKLGIKRYIQNFLSLFRCSNNQETNNNDTKITRDLDDEFVYVVEIDKEM